jgi:hypothetical protein
MCGERDLFVFVFEPLDGAVKSCYSLTPPIPSLLLVPVSFITISPRVSAKLTRYCYLLLKSLHVHVCYSVYYLDLVMVRRKGK